MIKPYQDEESKSEQIRRMFNRIAPAYDRMNHLMSWGMDAHWRTRAIELIDPYSPIEVLDVATGTGDLAIQILRNIASVHHVVGVDISEGMLHQGTEKVKAEGLENAIAFVKGDVSELPFETSSFDAITVAFGVRNFENLSLGLSEMLRVLRPGAPLMILELSLPRNPLSRAFYEFYTQIFIPRLGKALTKDGKAYTYLPRSIKHMPQRKEMVELLLSIGASEAYYRTLFPGTACTYMAIK